MSTQDSPGGRRRRDPRAERQARRSRGAPAAVSGEATGRPRTRRDPRAERAPLAGSDSGRPRRNLRPGRGATGPLASEASRAAPAAASPAVAAAPEPVRLEAPARWVLAVPDAGGGGLSDADRELLGAARNLAGEDGAVVALVPEGAVDLGAAGADRVLELPPELEPEVRAARIAAMAESLGAGHLLFPESAAGSELGRRVAAALGEWPSAAVLALEANQVACRCDAGRSERLQAPGRVLLLEPEAAEAHQGAPREARPVQAPAVAAQARIRDLGLLPVDPGSIPLAEAELILAAGSGVTDWNGFHRLARALGAAEGASRVVCDAGHLPRSRQVGASGTLVRAHCYIALGISGAPQHLQGITRCQHVLAVNADAHAEMMKRAELGVVADVQGVIPALLALLEREKDDEAA